jgi:CheY-like chemotaxis protein/GAF domain-containing protein
MAYHDPVMTSTRPRLVVLKGAVPLESGHIQALKSAFDVVEVHSAEAARKMLDGSVGGVVVCAPGEHLLIGGQPSPTAASTILERIGEGLAVVDAGGVVLWSDARFKFCDEQTRAEFIRVARRAIDEFNRPTGQQTKGARPTNTFTFASDGDSYEMVVSPASFDANQKERVTSVVGVMWVVTATEAVQHKIDAIDTAGAELLHLDPAVISKMNMGERLKLLEQRIIGAVRDVLRFDNFEVRLLDRETSQLELVIAVNIAPLKIGEVLYARSEGNGISGYVASTGQSYICSNVHEDARYREGLDCAGSSLTVPLLLHDRVVGVFNIESLQSGAFDDNDRRYAEIFGRYIAAAMNILDLLVVERYTTNQQVAQNVTGELEQPLIDIVTQVKALREADVSDRVREGLGKIDGLVGDLRRRLAACAAGPRTILGAEAELHRHEVDPLIEGRRILIADDEPAIRETLSALLRQKGAIVTVCSSGTETIDTLEHTRGGQPFDLVLSDIKMPDRNGYEVFRTAKSIAATTPVILMTGFGYDPHHSIVRASQEGLQTFLFKPFKASQLMDVLIKVLTPATHA